jgi:MoaA/NifB/PqqE/SkfB family radical SAM enzyme
MIGISKLYFGTIEESDKLRYAKGVHKRPIVVWNCTPACNLKCSHCYAATSGKEKVLSTGQALAVIDDLAEFNVPVLLFSGGEPLMRKDFFELAEYAAAKGIRPTLSTNGTLITVSKR